jgi:hypothetical protein
MTARELAKALDGMKLEQRMETLRGMTPEQRKEVRGLKRANEQIPARKAIPVIVVLVLLFVWAMSVFSGRSGEPMGSGAECTQKLSQVVTTSYLLDHGLQVKDSQAATIQVGGAIADVCLQGPSSQSVDDGAEKVVDWINARLDASG